MYILSLAACFFLLLPAPDDAAQLRSFADALEALPMLRSATARGAAVVLQNDPETIIRFVRDEIAYENYSGVLRGSVGTLLSRAGNSYDQAILLKELLDEAGLHTRLARGRLSAGDAEALMASVSARPQAAPDLSPADLEFLGIEPSSWNKQREELAGRIGAVLSTAASISAEGVDTAGRSAGSQNQIDVARDYLWVQLQLDGAWSDLHPAFPRDSAPSIRPSGVINYVANIPRGLFHWVRVRLIADIGGKTAAILDKRIPSASAPGRGISIFLDPQRGGEGLRLRPAVRVGDLILRDAEVSIDPESPLSGLSLEITVLSPGEMPRPVTLQLSSARPLDGDELGLSVDLVIVGGPPDWRSALQADVQTLGWLASISGGAPQIRERLAAGSFTAPNPILSRWASILPQAWATAYPDAPVYLDSPAVACALYLPRKETEGFSLSAGVGIVSLRTAAREGVDAARIAAVSRKLLEQLAGVSFEGAGERDVDAPLLRWTGPYTAPEVSGLQGELLRSVAESGADDRGVALYFRRHVLSPSLSALHALMAAHPAGLAAKLEKLLATQ